MYKIYNLTKEQSEHFREDMELVLTYNNVFDALYTGRIDWSNVSFDEEEERDGFLRAYEYWKENKLADDEGTTVSYRYEEVK